MDITSYFDKFITAKRAERLSESTIDHYTYALVRFFDWCKNNGYAGEELIGVTGAEAIEAHLNWLHSLGLADATLRHVFFGIRVFYKWMQKRDRKLFLDEGNPIEFITAPRAPSLLPKAISYDQMIALVHSIKGNRYIDIRDRLIIRLLFATGMRAGEFTSIKIEHIDFERRTIKVYRWKTRIEDFVPISRSLIPEIKDWINKHRPVRDDNTWLWATVNHNSSSADHLQPNGLQETLRRRCVEAELPIFRPHSFRHGCAANIIKRGGDIILVQRVLGHRDISTSQIYLRFDTDDLTALYDRVFE